MKSRIDRKKFGQHFPLFLVQIREVELKKKGQHFPLFLMQIKKSSSKKKIGQHFPLFYTKTSRRKKKKTKPLTCPGSRRTCARLGDDDVQDVPTRPHPLPAPIQATDFWAVCLWQGWGRVGGEGELKGTDSPLYPPSPGTIFSGRAKGRGNRGVTYDASIFPAPPPASPPQCPVRSWRDCDFLGWRGGGGGAGTRYQRPPYHPTYPNNPHNAPAPTRNHLRNSGQ